LVVLVDMSRVEEIAMRVFRIDKAIYLHDGGTAYNAFSWLNTRSSTRGITQNKGSEA